jgi:hypothetical protein
MPSPYMQAVDIGAQVAYPATPQVDVTQKFEPDEWFIVNEDPAVVCIASFDGVNDSFRLVPATATTGLLITHRGQKLWLKREGVAGAAAIVRVTANKYR